MRDIYREVKDRGPGPHVLTGPIEIRGACPATCSKCASSISVSPLDYGYNRQRPYTGALPEEFTALWTAHHSDQSPGQDRGGCARRRRAARSAVLRHHGRRAATGDGPHQQRAARRPHRQPRQQGSRRRHHTLHAGACAGRAVLGRRRACGARPWRGRSDAPSRPACADASSSSCART